MGMGRTIDGLIKEKALTPEEFERHRDLIDECRRREQRIDKYCSTARRGLQELSTSLRLLGEKSRELDRALENLNDTLDALSLILIPADKFHRA
jgi:chromosome segregation ATPase